MTTKNNLIIVLCALALFLPSLAPASTNISIGGTAWYVWWKPAWADNKSAFLYQFKETSGYWFEDSRDFKRSSAAMAGPIISIGFLDRWTISSVVVIGTMDFYTRGFAQGIDLYNETSGLTNKGYSRHVLKWDSDTTLGFTPHRYIKLYAGFKAQGYRYREITHFYDLSAFPAVYVDHAENTDSVNCYGPGMGIGATVPLVENLYLLANLSGVFLWCVEKSDLNLNRTYGLDSTGFVLSYIHLPRGKFISYGGTASLSLAYAISKINTTLALGGRYQLLYNRQRSGNILHNDVTMNIIDRQYDHFFGVTFSVIYTFTIGKQG